jgi:AraC family transcriptional regulator of adaptative response/methylated-DNA-[protein]-cysteine methyltransferase
MTVRQNTASIRAAQTLADARWEAVLTRQAASDGQFWYSVRTTGVYCRPSCGARTPRPENVSFHATQAAAVAAGFRPCRRCRPERSSLAELHASLITSACRLLDEPDAHESLSEVATKLGVSPFHLQRLFKSALGVSPRAYAEARRLSRLGDGLRSARSVTDAMLDAGFNSSSRAYALSAKALGMAPKTYRAGAPGVRLSFASGRCALGMVLVARSPRGLCAILLGDDAAGVEADLAARFPHAERVPADSALDEALMKVIALVEQPRRLLDLPLDIQGTAFQQRVWDALRRIPVGETRSYAQVAREIDRPGAERAVANACGANPLAVAIPCHRWGVARKQALLEEEQRG